MESIRWSNLDHDERMKVLKSRIWFGTQYYRPPQPPGRHWDKDFELMKQTGLEVVRPWIYWRWMERQPGEISWDDTDRLFDLADANGVYIHPLLFLESVPEWYIVRFPETQFVDHQRVSHYPLNRKSTQIGGMAVCGNHPLTKEWSGRFLRKLVDRYKDRDSLICWDVWNELQTKSAAGVCACNHCIEDYRSHVQEQYQSVAALNDAWHTCYGSWQDVTPPNGDNDYAAWFAWRRWQACSLARQALWRRQIIREADPRQVIMIHMPTKLSIPGRGCGDWDACVPSMDFAGNSSHIQLSQRDYALSDRLAARIMLTADDDMARQQSPNFGWACEISSSAANYHAAPEIRIDDFVYWIWKPLSMGLRGAIMWQFRFESYGPESPNCGLIDLDGGDTERRRELETIIGIDRKHDKLFSVSKPPVPELGLLVCPEQHMASVTLNAKIDGGRPLYQRCVLGLYDIARQAGLPAALVQPGGIPKDLKLLLVPRSVASRPDLKEALSDFLNGGGTAVIEGGFMCAEADSLMLEDVTPGLGMDSVLGLSEGRQVNTRWYGLTPGQDPTKKMSIEQFEDGWLNVGADGEMGQALADLAPELQFTIEWEGKKFPCSAGFDRRPLKVTDAEIIGRFGDGAPAVATRQVGKGRAFYVGTAASYTNSAYGGGYGSFILAVSQACGVKPPLPIEPVRELTWHTLDAGESRILFVHNHFEHEAEMDLSRCGNAEVIYGESDAIQDGILRCRSMSTTVLLLS